MDRCTYSLIGIDLGFSIGFAHFLFPMILEGHDAIPEVFVFCIPAILVGTIVLACQARLDTTLESLSKDYLSFTFALGVVLVIYLPAIGKIVGLVFLLAVTFLQTMILVNASVEFIRFEELSPSWYLAEETFSAIGIALGLIVPWVCSLTDTMPECLFFSAAIMTLVNIFAQTFINDGRFPSSENLSVLSLSRKEKDVDEEGASPKNVDALRGEAWVNSVNKICQEYNLSPRQSEILKLLANGRDSLYIENYFCISKSTTKSHIYNIYRKLSIHSRQELIDIVERNE